MRPGNRARRRQGERGTLEAESRALARSPMIRKEMRRGQGGVNHIANKTVGANFLAENMIPLQRRIIRAQGERDAVPMEILNGEH